MDEFARSAPEEQLVAIREAAQQLGLSAPIVEKDFWVCWTMRRLREHRDLADHLTFKGGTSLSKAYNAIDRFSEDIDLTIGRTAPFIRDTLPPMEEGISSNERERRIDALMSAAQQYVVAIVIPTLSGAMTTALGLAEGWQVVLAENDAQTVLVYYPRVANYGGGYGRGAYGAGLYGEGALGYIKPHIRLEFGARGENDPHEMRSFRPYLAEALPQLITDSQCQFPTLAAERTFWEKATILHALHHTGKIRDRLSRHYYDMHMLSQKGIADRAIALPDLLAQVVHNKSLMFREPKASYGTAAFGSLKLVPRPDAFGDLKADYTAMRDMFMADPPAFDAMMATIADLEAKINR